jgi:hypothetical protein
MRIKIKLRQPLFFGPRTQTALAATPPAPGPSFSAALRDCMVSWELQRAPAAPASAASASSPALSTGLQTRPLGPSPLARAWSWLHTKYTLTATKRLRLAETLSLGEKRFVALVSVEGREFLIGGCSTGVSLLAQLGGGPEPGHALRARMEGDAV